MPGLMVRDELPDRLTEAALPVRPGAARAAKGSVTTGAWVTGVGWKVAFPDAWKPPTTSMREAVTLALPLIVIAVGELESTSIWPGRLRLPLPETLSAPLAL